MSRTLKLIRLEQGAFNHVVSVLNNANAISRLVVSSLTEHRVNVFSLVPSEVPAKILYDFSVGGLCSSEESNHWLSRYIADYLDASENHFFIIEDLLVQPFDPSLDRVSSNYFCFKGEVFYYLDKDSNSIESVLDVLRKANRYPFIGFLVEADISLKKEIIDDNVSSALIEILSDKVETAFIGAYDEESYLITTWNSSHTPY